jgi:hypothetical protein
LGGQKTGVWTTWHPNGQKAIRSEFLAGVPVSFSRWGPDGKLAEVFKSDGTSGPNKESAGTQALPTIQVGNRGGQLIR